MKYAVLILFLALSLGAVAQDPGSKSVPAKKTIAARSKPVATPTPLSEKEQFESASAHELAIARVPALEQFLAAFPESEHRPAAIDLLASSRVLIAEEKLLAGQAGEAVAIFKQVVEEIPRPIPNEIFRESIAKIPMALFRRGQRTGAAELAMLIESKAEDNAGQLAELANFYLSIENGAEAMRVAAKAAAKDPTSPAVHRTLALAHRINFDLELSADSYAKALELEPDSFAAKRGLAEMKRALGKSDEAVALYRELLAKNDDDSPSRTGLVLALFDAGQRAEAEAELAKAVEKTPGNFVLLAGAAYWYASRGIGDRAVELAQKAIDREPRYIWSHIALARGLVHQGKPVAAEQVLIKARVYGNFPTLEYELASARLSAGFYREAVEDLAVHFSVSPGGVRTRLGGRLPREEKSLSDLVAHERKASIFAPKGADTPENAETLKALLELDQKLRSPQPNEAEIAAAAEAFAKGTDKMRLHRQLYAAGLLLQKRVALAEVLELTKAATGNTDAALDVPDPGAAVMANELYEARAAAFRKNDFLVVPVVPRPTLSAILRGRIEEISGWALYNQNNFADAVIRLRRAVSVMPDDSTWWRSSMWRLGAALAADGKDAEALNAYIESYRIDSPDFAKYTVVEALYKKVHGTIDGLEAKIGRERVGTPPVFQDVASSPSPAPVSTETSELPAAETPPAAGSTVETSVAEPVKTEPVKTEPSDAEPIKTEPPQSEPVKTEPSDAEPIKTEPVKTEPSDAEPIKTEPPQSEPVKTEPTEPAAAIQPEVVPAATPDNTDPPAAAQKPVDQTETPAEPPKPPIVEPKPVEVKTEDPGKKEPEPGPVTDDKAAVVKKSDKPAAEQLSASRPLFEPVIITIPRNRPAKPGATDANKTASAGPPATSGADRPRKIEGKEVTGDTPPPCVIAVSQEHLSLLSGGGTVGILVSVDQAGDIKNVTAMSSSSKDVEVTLEPEIGGMPDRRFYVIKSISSSVGVYQVTFAAPCGKKEVIVTVR